LYLLPSASPLPAHSSSGAGEPGERSRGPLGTGKQKPLGASGLRKWTEESGILKCFLLKAKQSWGQLLNGMTRAGGWRVLLPSPFLAATLEGSTAGK